MEHVNERRRCKSKFFFKWPSFIHSSEYPFLLRRDRGTDKIPNEQMFNGLHGLFLLYSWSWWWCCCRWDPFLSFFLYCIYYPLTRPVLLLPSRRIMNTLPGRFVFRYWWMAGVGGSSRMRNDIRRRREPDTLSRAMLQLERLRHDMGIG